MLKKSRDKKSRGPQESKRYNTNGKYSRFFPEGYYHPWIYLNVFSNSGFNIIERADKSEQKQQIKSGLHRKQGKERKKGQFVTPSLFDLEQTEEADLVVGEKINWWLIQKQQWNYSVTRGTCEATILMPQSIHDKIDPRKLSGIPKTQEKKQSNTIPLITTW